MAVYYTIRCPHCQQILKQGKNKSKEFGSPLRNCRYCDRIYVDKDYIEAGLLTDWQLNLKLFFSHLWRIITSILLIAFSIVLLIGFFTVDFSASHLILLIPMAFGFVIGGWNFVDIFCNRDERRREIQKAIQKSNQRLSNPYYVLALHKAKISVPKYMLERAKNDILKRKR